MDTNSGINDSVLIQGFTISTYSQRIPMDKYSDLNLYIRSLSYRESLEASGMVSLDLSQAFIHILAEGVQLSLMYTVISCLHEFNQA